MTTTTARTIAATTNTPAFTGLTETQWHQYAALVETTLHYETLGLVPANIVELTNTLHQHPTALEPATITAALAAGYLTARTGTITGGKLEGEQVAYITTTPPTAYGSPYAATIVPELWKLPAALWQHDTLTQCSLYACGHYIELIIRAHELEYETGIIPGHMVAPAALPELLERGLLVQQHPGGSEAPAYHLALWHHIETARQMCAGELTFARPPKALTARLLDRNGLSCTRTSEYVRLEPEHLGWTYNELVDPDVTA